MGRLKGKSFWKTAARFALWPALFYFGLFVILTYPAITHFSTFFYTDAVDGYGTIWNLWWVHKAIAELHQSPWFTPMFHWPHGTSLHQHNLMLFNGLVGVPLLHVLSLVQAYNTLLILSFVWGGLAAFGLAYALVRHYEASLLAGVIYAFTNYNFAHAEGLNHMLIIEWIPVFLGLFYFFLEDPTLLKAIAAVVAVGLVALSNYYYLFYALLGAVMMLMRKGLELKKTSGPYLRRHRVPLFVFLVASAAVLAPDILAVLHLNNPKDPLFVSGHPADLYSLDLLGLWIPGGHWRFAQLTEPFWAHLPGNIHESSVHFGTAILAMLYIGWFMRKTIHMKTFYFWYAFGIFFFVLALGPAPQIAGISFPSIRMPYAWFEAIFPLLRLSGCPVRFVVMIALAASMIIAMIWKTLDEKKPAHWNHLRWLWLGLLLFESWPRALASAPSAVPDYVRALAALPSNNQGAIDLVGRITECMYYQTVHQKPLAFGFFARTRVSETVSDRQIMMLILARKYDVLSKDFHFRYIIAPPFLRSRIGMDHQQPVFASSQAQIYEFPDR